MSQPAKFRLTFSAPPASGAWYIGSHQLNALVDTTSVFNAINTQFPGWAGQVSGDQNSGFDIEWGAVYQPPSEIDGGGDGTPNLSASGELFDQDNNPVTVLCECVQRNVWEPAE